MSRGISASGLRVGLTALLLAMVPTGGWSAPSGQERFRLNFRDVEIGKVLQFFSIAAGKTLVKPPGLTGPVTVLGPRPVTLAQAFETLDSVLRTRGYTLEQGPLLLRVVPAQRTASESSARAPVSEQREAAQPREVSQAAAESRASLNSARPQVTVLRLEAASASQVARIVNELFRPQGATRGRGSRNSRNRRNNRNTALSAGPAVRASADEYTNSVVVVAPAPLTESVRRVVEQLDQKVAPSVIPRIFRLQHASAEELAPVMSQVLLGVAPTSAAGGALQNVSRERRARMAARSRSQNTTTGQVVADARTNSMIVTTTPENLAVVEEVVRRLDTRVPPEPTTLVIPLENARSLDVGLLLNQALGGTNRGYGYGVTGTNRGYGYGVTGTNSRDRTTGQRRTTNPVRTNRSPYPQGRTRR